MDPQDAYEIGRADGENGGESLYPDALTKEARAAYERGLAETTN